MEWEPTIDLPSPQRMSENRFTLGENGCPDAHLKRTLCLILKKPVDFRDRPIESNDCEAMVGGVHYQVLAHNGQADEAKISTVNSRRSADIDASETSAEVSSSTKLIN